MLKVLVSYPTQTEEFVIVERMTGALENVQKVIDTGQLLALQEEVDKVYVDPALIEYSVKLVSATRHPEQVGGKNSHLSSCSVPARGLRLT